VQIKAHYAKHKEDQVQRCPFCERNWTSWSIEVRLPETLLREVFTVLTPIRNERVTFTALILAEALLLKQKSVLIVESTSATVLLSRTFR